MRTKAIYRPGQMGVRDQIAEHGEQLIAVRCRYDDETKKYYRTIELVIDERDWERFAPSAAIG